LFRLAKWNVFTIATVFLVAGAASASRPNILIAISDDQSHPHASAYGDGAIGTPAFDRVAKSGVLFRNAFTPAPGCSPMRAAFLTGREIWQIREAGTHASFFPRDLPVFTEQLAGAGYHVGMTGKGWGPGKAEGWPHNPAGKSYGRRKMKSPGGISSNDYAANFADFLKECDRDQPFCFWFGGSEPHRTYEQGIGNAGGVDPEKIKVPAFLPDSQTIRSDIADYMYEIQWFDSQLARILDQLHELGQLENTLVIVTSDNGMPFPRAKANLYEYGIHMPLAIAWPERIPAGQDNEDLVSLIDVTRTIFHAAGVTPKQADKMSGRDLLSRLTSESDKTSPLRNAVFCGRERHSSSRYNSLGYPCRCIRTKTHLLIRNFTPQRWPAGTALKYDKAKYDASGGFLSGQLGALHGGYHDIDDSPTLRWMIANRDQPNVGALLAAAVDLRPREELYDIEADPACMRNLADDESAREIRADLAGRLTEHLTRTGDLRQTDPEAAHVWETYPRVSSLRWFPVPDWAREHPEQVPRQDWMEKRRPR
jgi:uncharacterized sulfatase